MQDAQIFYMGHRAACVSVGEQELEAAWWGQLVALLSRPGSSGSY